MDADRASKDASGAIEGIRAMRDALSLEGLDVGVLKQMIEEGRR